MDTIFPFFIICILPLIWTAAVFALGRWSVRYRVTIRDRGETPYHPPAPQAQQDYYRGFEEA